MSKDYTEVAMKDMDPATAVSDFAENHLEEKVERILSGKDDPARQSRHDEENVKTMLEVNPEYALQLYQTPDHSKTKAEKHVTDVRIPRSTDRVGMHKGKKGFLISNNPLHRPKPKKELDWSAFETTKKRT